MSPADDDSDPVAKANKGPDLGLESVHLKMPSKGIEKNSDNISIPRIQVCRES